jgi:hypothetical protein
VYARIKFVYAAAGCELPIGAAQYGGRNYKHRAWPLQPIEREASPGRQYGWTSPGDNSGIPRNGAFRTPRRPAWWRGCPLRHSRQTSPMAGASEDDSSGPLPSFGENRAPRLCRNDRRGHSTQGAEDILGDADVPTVEAPNIFSGDELPPVTYTDEHGNVTVGQMQDLSLSDSPVNSDTNEEAGVGTSAGFGLRTSGGTGIPPQNASST